MMQEKEPDHEYYDPNVVNDDFPREETFECWDAMERVFIISCLQFPGIGFQLKAVEKAKNGQGYEFSTYSESSPYAALGELRKKMKRELSRRFISKERSPSANQAYYPLHDIVEGRITSDERGLPAFIIDGIMISHENLLEIFEMHEGWKFKICFAELSEQFSD